MVNIGDLHRIMLKFFETQLLNHAGKTKLLTLVHIRKYNYDSR